MSKQTNTSMQQIALQMISDWHNNAVPELLHLQAGLALLDYPRNPVGHPILPPYVVLPEPATQQGVTVQNAIKVSHTPMKSPPVSTPVEIKGTRLTTRSSEDTKPLPTIPATPSMPAPVPIATVLNPTTVTAVPAVTPTPETPSITLAPMIEGVLCKPLSAQAQKVIAMTSAEITKLALSSPDEVVPALEELQKRKQELSTLVRRFQVECGRRIRRAQEPPRTKAH